MMKIQLSNSNHFREALLLLSEDEQCNLYQIDILENFISDHRYEWRAVYKDGSMMAVSLSSNRPFPGFPSGLCVPYGDREACFILGEWEKERGGTRHVFAEQEACDAFYEGLGCPPTYVHSSERMFFADFIPKKDSYLPLRSARVEELEELIGMAAQMQEEDLGYNPLDKHRDSFRISVRDRIREKRILIGEIDKKVGFMIDVGTRCTRGTQVGSMFVPDDFRGQGIGVLGMRGCLNYLLPTSSFVSLLAREKNIPAMKTHRRTGYTEGKAFRIIFMNP